MPQHSKRGQTFAKRFAGWRRKRGVTRDRFTFDSFHNNVARALELAQVDRDLAAHVIGHDRSFTYRVYNPDGVDLRLLRDVVERVAYPGLSSAAPRIVTNRHQHQKKSRLY